MTKQKPRIFTDAGGLTQIICEKSVVSVKIHGSNLYRSRPAHTFANRHSSVLKTWRQSSAPHGESMRGERNCLTGLRMPVAKDGDRRISRGVRPSRGISVMIRSCAKFNREHGA